MRALELCAHLRWECACRLFEETSAVARGARFWRGRCVGTFKGACLRWRRAFRAVRLFKDKCKSRGFLARAV